MKTYETLDELWLEELQNVFINGHRTGSRDGATREVLGAVIRLENPCANFVFNPVRRLHPSYAAAELLWYLSGSANIRMMEAYAPQYKRFVSGPLDDGVNAHGGYGFRLAGDKAFHETQNTLSSLNRWVLPVQDDFHDGSRQVSDKISMITQILRRKPESRQAIINLWQGGDLIHAYDGGVNDLPCTLSLQFKLQDGKLNCICTMRSNDIWLGLPYDIFCWTCIQRLIAEALEVEPGWYQHQAGSLHLYDRNEEKARKALDVEYRTSVVPFGRHEMHLRHVVPEALRLEGYRRQQKTDAGGSTLRDMAGERSMLYQLCQMAAVKWGKPKIHNQAMAEYAKENFYANH